MGIKTIYEIIMQDELESQEPEYDSFPDEFTEIFDDLMDETQQFFSEDSEDYDTD